MSDDALERLKKRQRPTVPVRDAALDPGNVETLISSDLKQKQPVTPLESIQTKQSTLRLEAELSDRLSGVCRENGISREVLLEALFHYYEKDQQAWQAILLEAKERAEKRLKIANFRRAQSMMQRFTDVNANPDLM